MCSLIVVGAPITAASTPCASAAVSRCVNEAKDAFAAAAAHFTFLQRIHISGTGSQVEWSLDDINDSKEMFFTAVKGAAVAKESLWLDLIHVMTPTSGQHPHVPSLLRIRRYYTFYYTDGNDLLRVFSPTKFNALGCGIFFNEDRLTFSNVPGVISNGTGSGGLSPVSGHSTINSKSANKLFFNIANYLTSFNTFTFNYFNFIYSTIYTNDSIFMFNQYYLSKSSNRLRN